MTIPAEYLVKEILTFDMIMNISAEPSVLWEVTESDGCRLMKKKQGDLYCYREEATVKAPAVSVFQYLIDCKHTSSIYSNVESMCLLKAFSPHAWAKLIKFNKKTISTQRYILTLDHWCMLADGRIVIHSRSEDMGELVPLPPLGDLHKGQLHFSGFLISPCGEEGCQVTFIHKLDLRGGGLSIQLPLASKSQHEPIPGKAGLVNLREQLAIHFKDAEVLHNTVRVQELSNVASVVLSIKSVEWRIEGMQGEDGEDQDLLRGSLFTPPHDVAQRILSTRNSDRGTAPELDDIESSGGEGVGGTSTGPPLPEAVVQRGVHVFEHLMRISHPAFPNWSSWFERDRVVVRRMLDRDSDPTTMRQDALVNASLPTIFQYLLDIRNSADWNADLYHTRTLRVYSSHTFLRVVKMRKSAMMLSLPPRYLLLLSHWRLLEDGRVIVMCRSDNFPELYTPVGEEAGLVLATLHYAAFFLESRGPLGCLVTYIRKVDLGGALMPPVAVDAAMRLNPVLALANMQRAVSSVDASGAKQRLVGNTLLDSGYDRLLEIAEQTLGDEDGQEFTRSTRTRSFVPEGVGVGGLFHTAPPAPTAAAAQQGNSSSSPPLGQTTSRPAITTMAGIKSLFTSLR